MTVSAMARNNPCFMPWDNKLNKNVSDFVGWNVIFTMSLGKDDAKKFSLATPKKTESAYLRAMGCELDESGEFVLLDKELAPGWFGKYMLTDFKLCYGRETITTVLAKGKARPAGRNGHRRSVAGEKGRGRGGKRTKKKKPDLAMMHPDSRAAYEGTMAGIVAKHAQAAAPNDAAAMATSAGLDMMVEAAEAVGAEQEEINVADEDAVAGVMVAMIDDFATDDSEWEYDTDEEGGEGEVLEELMELVT